MRPPGTAISGHRDSSPEIQPRAILVSAETKRQRQSPPFAGHLQVSGKSRGSKECVVADAVVIEPVSASQFPANREKNREFCNFEAPSRIRRPASPMISGAFLQIPYSAEQGNFAKEQGI